MNMMTAIVSPPSMPLPGIAQLFRVERELKLRRLFAHFDRGEVEQAVDLLIAMLDEREGDPDIEPNGDELDGNLAEDDAGGWAGKHDVGAGCPISDSDSCAAKDDNLTDFALASLGYEQLYALDDDQEPNGDETDHSRCYDYI